MMRLYLIRHGETDWNRAGKLQGHRDIRLNDFGRGQAARLQPYVAKWGIDKVLTSDLSRARETGEILARGREGLELKTYPELRECHLGECEGLSAEQILEKLGPDAVDLWRSSDPKDWHYRFPGGESSHEILARMNRVVSQILRDHPETKALAVVSHGGVLRRYLRSLAPEFSDQLPWITNGMVFEVELDPVTLDQARLSLSIQI